jgi:proline dehydrogenase
MSLLGTPLIWAAETPAVRHLFTSHPLGRRLAGRFVPGDSLDDGMRAVGELADRGIGGILNHLGENVASAAQAAEATDAYVRALKRIEETPGADCAISVKLTQLGLDESVAACRDNVERVLQAATRADGATLVMIDMESSRYVDATLELYLRLRDGHSNVGVCVQSCLHRTPEDVRRIAAPGAVVRVCKGAYSEPADIALRSRREVSIRFTQVVATLMASGAVVHVATHDPSLVEGMQAYVRARSISRVRYEFQMLYGIRRDLQARLVRHGEPVRVFVPYGSAWYPYLTRRLAERPANVWFFASNALRRDG